MNFDKNLNCWVLTEGMAGTENQCLAVCDSLGIHPEIKRVTLKQPWKMLSPYLGFEHAGIFIPKLTGPWPDLLIASGRKSIAASRYIKQKSSRKTFTVQIQDPRVNPAQFDLVAIPSHDPTRGENVIVTTAAPNLVTPEKLNAAMDAFPALGALPGPRVAVLVGGNSKDFELTPKITGWMIEALQNLNAGLMISTSRRTPRKCAAMIKDAFVGDPHAFLYDGEGPNPYHAFLAYADYVLVTIDSVSMASDAATAGKPIYVLGMKRRRRNSSLLQNKSLWGEIPTSRVESFHMLLSHKGISRPFEGKLEKAWDYTALNDAAVIAKAIQSRILNRS